MQKNRISTRLRIVGLIALLVLSVNVPTALFPVAQAVHITEPSTPITGIVLRVWQYAKPDTIVDCSTTDDVSIAEVRADVFVRANSAPSEHFTVRTTFDRWETASGGFWMPMSRGYWLHQNAPPHAANISTFGWYGISVDQRISDHPGLWRVTVRVDGQVSGQIITSSCTFRKVS